MICFIDFETTGINVFRDEPIEFAAVLVDSELRIVTQFQSRIKPEKKLFFKKSASAIHNLTADDLIEAPTQRQVLEKFFSEVGTDFRFAGWNITFDVTFMRRLCNRNGFMSYYNKINHRHLDIQTMNYLANVMQLYGTPCSSLSDVVNYFGLSRNKNHLALEDTLLTFRVFVALQELFKSQRKSG